MSTIRMLTEEVRDLSRRTCQEADNFLREAHDLSARVRSMNWSGPGAEQFRAEFEALIRALERDCEALNRLGIQCNREVDQWEEGAAALAIAAWAPVVSSYTPTIASTPGHSIGDIREMVCGGMSGGAKDRCETIWSQPPGNAEELAYMIMNMPEDMPIAILQIGNGEYLVLLRGTVGGVDQGHNWGSAFESMFGNSSYQNSVVDALNNANLPDGATIHLAGHSQGGMVAQNLSVDPRVTGHLDVKTVTSFGSPDTLAPANPNVDRYVSFEAPMDYVTGLDEIIGHRDYFNPVEVHIVGNDLEAWSPLPGQSHGVYDNPGVLTNHDIPFDVDPNSWEGVHVSGTDVSTSGPNVYKGIVRGWGEIKDVATTPSRVMVEGLIGN